MINKDNNIDDCLFGKRLQTNVINNGESTFTNKIKLSNNMERVKTVL